ncbi:hypothetical protein JGU71_04330 [Antrihabitans sp. YC3-6]|uniref:Tetracyclin repressor-like C-terminal domain-containing protein n=1 Tax=Antrihabitans stalagmiti TaxID=2799499 RepID=A0A934NMX7_9NOCA|nr:hypothetical protein [Antrihabitans stalagmiti]MBJ8338105.1 hypothetical protein [Antrihabitans stalagmiti]
MSAVAETEGSAAFTEYGEALAAAAVEAHTGDRAQLGETLIGTFLKFWDDPQLRPQLLEKYRAAFTSETGAAEMRHFMSSGLFAQAVGKLDDPPKNIEEVAKLLGVPPLQVNAAVSQVMGVIMLRYVVKVEPIASAAPEEIRAIIAPTVQRYLVG